jgi:hypothetical protein
LLALKALLTETFRNPYLAFITANYIFYYPLVPDDICFDLQLRSETDGELLSE